MQVPLLNQAIETTQVVEQLQATKAEWEALDKQARRASSRKGLGILALGGTFLILTPIACVVTFTLGQEADILGVLKLFGTAMILLGGLVGSILLITSSSKAVPSGYQQLKTAREEWQAKLMPRKTWEQVVALFGKKNSAGYRNIRTSRENQIRAVLGHVEGFERFLPAGELDNPLTMI